MNLTTVIVDDEDLAIDLLQHFIHFEPEFKVLETFTDATQALEYLKKNQPEVIFLDIQMPQLNGLDLIESLNYSPIIVLITAYAEYAQKAYELDVIDYLLKPYDKSRFEKTIGKIKRFAHFKSNITQEIKNNCLFVKHHGLLKEIEYSEIIFIEGLKQYVKIVTPQGKYITLSSMKNLEVLLQPFNFKRVHKSYIVNFNHALSKTGNFITIDSFEIPIGRVYKTTLLD